MLFNIVILFMVASIAWVLWTERKSKQALEKDALDQAWREVPDDPHYIERRHYEERMRVEDEARAAAAKRRMPQSLMQWQKWLKKISVLWS
jgi:hypothetical protein